MTSGPSDVVISIQPWLLQELHTLRVADASSSSSSSSSDDSDDMPDIYCTRYICDGHANVIGTIENVLVTSGYTASTRNTWKGRITLLRVDHLKDPWLDDTEREAVLPLLKDRLHRELTERLVYGNPVWAQPLRTSDAPLLSHVYVKPSLGVGGRPLWYYRDYTTNLVNDAANERQQPLGQHLNFILAGGPSGPSDPRSRDPRHGLTRQPARGRRQAGGNWIGEMARHNVLEHRSPVAAAGSEFSSEFLRSVAQRHEVARPFSFERTLADMTRWFGESIVFGRRPETENRRRAVSSDILNEDEDARFPPPMRNPTPRETMLPDLTGGILAEMDVERRRTRERGVTREVILVDEAYGMPSVQLMNWMLAPRRLPPMRLRTPRLGISRLRTGLRHFGLGIRIRQIGDVVVEDAEIRAIVQGRRATRRAQKTRTRRRHRKRAPKRQKQRRLRGSAGNPRRAHRQTNGRRAGASYRSSGQH